MAHDVFISYSSKDKVIADAVCARLEARGIRCWIAPRDVRPGAPYGEEIIDGIHEARVMVLVLSANANASPHIPKEVERAVSRGVSIIPLRVENVFPAKSLDYFISSVHWLDAITPPLESHLESLAATIRTLLPEGSQKVPPPVESQVVAVSEKATTAPPIATAAGNAMPKWLWPAVGAGVLCLAATAWYFLGRKPDAGPGGQAAGPIVVPTVVTPSQPRVTAPLHGQPNPTGIDPIIGCWHWINNATVVINGDGSMTAGPFTAHWRVANRGRRVYNFSWPEAVDSITMSADGRGLSGGNQYGIPMTAIRVSPGQDLTGSWRWYNGVTVNILPNGTFVALTTHGRWQMTGPSTYALTWPGPVDTVTMSSDLGRVSGRNQYGFPISGTKTPVCGG